MSTLLDVDVDVDVAMTASFDFDGALMSDAAVDTVGFSSSPSLEEEESVSHSCANGLSAIAGVPH